MNGTHAGIVRIASLALVAIVSGADRPAHRIETDRLILEWSEPPEAGEAEAVKAEAERLFQLVTDLLDVRHEAKVTILLEGPAERPGGRRDYPRVDSGGRIHLFKFVPSYENYFGALAHEYVHALRINRLLIADWFFEEGLAEFVALRADPSLAGFPWFDFPVTVVAGQWIAGGEDIPLSTLRERHREVNLACRAQSYALRSSFFDWLGRTYGDQVVLEAAKKRPAGILEDYEKHFGRTFEQLEALWRESLLSDYRAIDGVDAIARKYREDSPIQYQRVCIAGEDF